MPGKHGNKSGEEFVDVEAEGPTDDEEEEEPTDSDADEKGNLRGFVVDDSDENDESQQHVKQSSNGSTTAKPPKKKSKPKFSNDMELVLAYKKQQEEAARQARKLKSLEKIMIKAELSRRAGQKRQKGKKSTFVDKRRVPSKSSTKAFPFAHQSQRRRLTPRSSLQPSLSRLSHAKRKDPSRPRSPTTILPHSSNKRKSAHTDAPRSSVRQSKKAKIEQTGGTSGDSLRSTNAAKIKEESPDVTEVYTRDDDNFFLVKIKKEHAPGSSGGEDATDDKSTVKDDEYKRYLAEVAKRRKEYDVDDSLLTRKRLRGRHNKKVIRPEETERDGIRTVTGMRSHKEACNVNKVIRQTLAENNIPLDMSWGHQTNEDRLMAIACVYERMREIRLFWTKGMVREKVMLILKDSSKLCRQKLNHYQPMSSRDRYHAPPRPKKYFEDPSLPRDGKKQEQKQDIKEEKDSKPESEKGCGLLSSKNASTHPSRQPAISVNSGSSSTNATRTHSAQDKASAAPKKTITVTQKEPSRDGDKSGRVHNPERKAHGSKPGASRQGEARVELPTAPIIQNRKAKDTPAKSTTISRTKPVTWSGSSATVIDLTEGLLIGAFWNGRRFGSTV
ncbi:hypothetical protein BJ508DRAFT_345773 [Ascobolus immersus RN42]|uniref:Uncharacterized protein n=1 Tax=Ascobolus immersus RN42 TaxID=1160509 RepID=A0A3N4I6N8_ASCIM|nr:hypothetical protein BJ508DRAFT_345773 [Ascobolus immersus RN42]